MTNVQLPDTFDLRVSPEPEFVVLDELPPSRLPAIERVATANKPASVAPRDAIESLLANAFAELLGVTTLGVFDDFFEMGGNSLLAIRAMARLRDFFISTSRCATSWKRRPWPARRSSWRTIRNGARGSKKPLGSFSALPS